MKLGSANIRARARKKKEMPPFFAAARRNQKTKNKTHAQPKGNAKEKFNFTNHSRVITWKMNFFLFFRFFFFRSADDARAERCRPISPRSSTPPWLAPPFPRQTNNSQFVRFNFGVCFVKFFNFTFVINQTRAPNWLKVNDQPGKLASLRTVWDSLNLTIDRHLFGLF